MFRIITICSIIVTITASSDSSYGYGNTNQDNSYGYDTHKPMPYNFGYDNKDHYGTTLTRHETADGHGLVKGSYSYSTGHGISRLVEYEADHNGFRATVKTNEPGTQLSYPAHVNFLGPVHAWAEQRSGYNSYGSNDGSNSGSSYSSSYGPNLQQQYNSLSTQDSYGGKDLSSYGSNPTQEYKSLSTQDSYGGKDLSSNGSNLPQEYKSLSTQDSKGSKEPISYNSDYNYASSQQKAQTIVLPKQTTYHVLPTPVVNLK